jgi:hypothetical protein
MAGLRAATILYSDEELEAYLFGLAFAGWVNLTAALRDGRPFPLLYDSGVRYVREPPGSEVWQIPRDSYASKSSDCEDLGAGWRVPELWLLGETAARPFLKRVNEQLRHIQVERADGSIEDPSVICGMRGPDKARQARALVKPTIATPLIPILFSRNQRAA